MESNTPTKSANVDELLEVLSTAYAHDIVAYFRDLDETFASLQELASGVDKQDHGGTERLALRLHHSTLPRLAQIGVVEYDPKARTVRYRGNRALEALATGIPNR